MRRIPQFWLGFGLASVLWSCAAATTIPWPYYGLQLAEYRGGKLQAVDPKNDKDISFCQPASGQKGKCIVLDGPDFYALKADYLKCHSDLDSCQRGR